MKTADGRVGQDDSEPRNKGFRITKETALSDLTLIFLSYYGSQIEEAELLMKLPNYIMEIHGMRNKRRPNRIKDSFPFEFMR